MAPQAPPSHAPFQSCSSRAARALSIGNITANHSWIELETSAHARLASPKTQGIIMIRSAEDPPHTKYVTIPRAMNTVIIAHRGFVVRTHKVVA